MMNIGQAAKATGVSAKMIRYYEDSGLIGPTARSDAGYRLYGERDLHTLGFIKRSRDLGFSVERIAALLQLWNDRSRHSADVKAMALEHVALLRQRIDELQEMVATVQALADCCSGDERPDCPILVGIEHGRGSGGEGHAATFGVTATTPGAHHRRERGKPATG